MLRMVSWILSSTRIAPSAARMVLMKKFSKPPVVACVTINKPTPSTVHERLMSIARFFAVRKRQAMSKLGDMTARIQQEVRTGGLFDQLGTHTIAVPELVQVLHDDLFPGCEALGNFNNV